MAQQLKKKFIGNDQIDSTKIKLLQDQSIRGTDSTGSEVDLVKLGSSDEVLVKGVEVSLKADLEAESTARQSEVSNLQSQIDNILSNVDPAALDSLTEIVEAFQSADDDINAAITALGTGSQSALNQEILDRQTADTDLQNQIDAEEASRISADQGLQSAIDVVAGDLSQEVSDRVSGDQALQTELDATQVGAGLESDGSYVVSDNGFSSFIAGTTSLKGSIDSLDLGMIQHDQAIGQEIQDRIDADQLLQDNIDSVISDLDQEILDRQTLEGEFDAYVVSNDAALAQEIQDRIAAVSDEEQRALAAEGALQSQITQEISDRQAGDQALEDSKVNRSGDTITGQLTINSVDGLFVDSEEGSTTSVRPSNVVFENSNGITTEIYDSGVGFYFDDGNTSAEAYYEANGATVVYFDENGDPQPKMPQLPEELTTKAYVDQEISALSSGGLAQVISDLAQEVQDRIDGDSNLQSQIDTEKGRIDAILDASEANKDSFAEIVALINSVDTENDTAFAGYVLSNDAALAQEVSDRQAGDTTLQSNIDTVSSDLAQEISDRQTLEGEFDAYVVSNDAALAQEVSDRTSADSNLQSQIDQVVSDLAQEVLDRQADVDTEEQRALAAESVLQDNIDAEAVLRDAADVVLQQNIDSEESARIAADDLLDGRVSVLESVVFFKEKFVLTSTDISNEFVTLSHTPESNSMSAFVDRLAIHEGAGEDYSISGTTMTFLNEMVGTGNQKLQAGDTIYVKYQYKM